MPFLLQRSGVFKKKTHKLISALMRKLLVEKYRDVVPLAQLHTSVLLDYQGESSIIARRISSLIFQVLVSFRFSLQDNEIRYKICLNWCTYCYPGIMATFYILIFNACVPELLLTENLKH